MQSNQNLSVKDFSEKQKDICKIVLDSNLDFTKYILAKFNQVKLEDFFKILILESHCKNNEQMGKLRSKLNFCPEEKFKAEYKTASKNLKKEFNITKYEKTELESHLREKFREITGSEPKINISDDKTDEIHNFDQTTAQTNNHSHPTNFDFNSQLNGAFSNQQMQQATNFLATFLV